MADTKHDVTIVGAGPNGLAAAISLAAAGYDVRLVEGAPEIGGGVRSEELTLPGLIHDPCASVLPLAAASPFFRSLDLQGAGVRWIQPPIAVAHPFDNGDAAVLYGSVDDTARELERDGRAYRRLMQPLVDAWDTLVREILRPIGIPRNPLTFSRFAIPALLPATTLARSAFSTDRARALFAGIAAHAVMPLHSLGTSAFALVLGAAGHVVGWPFVQGGSGRLTAALGRILTDRLRGHIDVGTPVDSLDQLGSPRVILLDLAPREVRRIAGPALTPGYRRALDRFRHGPGVFKVDWALTAPVPWRSPRCAMAGTLHLGGSFDEVVNAEAIACGGSHADRPFVIAAQPSLFDPSRSRDGLHTFWAYCHVPPGSQVDMTDRIEAQIERFAPGFRQIIAARQVRTPRDLEAANPNMVGGDVVGGENSLLQVLFRPAGLRRPYRTSLPHVFICSASTPPGGGVHGMCGMHAAREARRVLDHRRSGR